MKQTYKRGTKGNTKAMIIIIIVIIIIDCYINKFLELWITFHRGILHNDLQLVVKNLFNVHVGELRII